MPFAFLEEIDRGVRSEVLQEKEAEMGAFLEVVRGELSSRKCSPRSEV